MITLCKCGAMTTPGEKYCKSCYIDTLKDDVSKNIFTGGRFYERRNMREKIAQWLSMSEKYGNFLIWDGLDKSTQENYRVRADRFIDFITEEIEKVAAPGGFAEDIEIFEQCRQKILSLLRPNNVVGNAEL